MRSIYIFFLFSFFSCGIFAQVKTIKVRKADTSCTVFIEGVKGDTISLEKLKTLDKIELRGGGCDCEKIVVCVWVVSKRGNKCFSTKCNQLTEDIKSEFRLVIAGNWVWFEIARRGKKGKIFSTRKFKVI